MDIKEKINEIVENAKDINFKKEFSKDPVKAVEKIVGVDLPDEQVKEIVENVKNKIDLTDIKEEAKDVLNEVKEGDAKGAFDKIKGMFDGQ